MPVDTPESRLRATTADVQEVLAKSARWRVSTWVLRGEIKNLEEELADRVRDLEALGEELVKCRARGLPPATREAALEAEYFLRWNLPTNHKKMRQAATIVLASLDYYRAIAFPGEA